MNHITLSYGELKKMYPETTEQYGNQLTEKDRYESLTVGQNLDSKIASLRRELDRLERSKLTLGPLLDMNINDLRNAMSY